MCYSKELNYSGVSVSAYFPFDKINVFAVQYSWTVNSIIDMKLNWNFKSNGSLTQIRWGVKILLWT